MLAAGWGVLRVDVMGVVLHVDGVGGLLRVRMTGWEWPDSVLGGGRAEAVFLPGFLAFCLAAWVLSSADVPGGGGGLYALGMGVRYC